MASFKTRKARVRISPLSDHLHPESGHDKKQQLQLQCLLMPHKISPSVSLSHPLIGINRPLVSLLIPTSHRSDTWGKGFRAAQVHSERKITGSVGKMRKKKRKIEMMLLNYAILLFLRRGILTAVQERFLFPWHCRHLLGPFPLLSEEHTL